MAQKEFVNLSTEYRPTTFSEVVGQKLAISALKRIAHAEGIACRSIFLHGSFGSGKTTLSRIFGKALNCSKFKETDDVCNSCSGCQEAQQKNSSLYYEFDSSRVGSIDAIRALQPIFELSPQGRRVFVFDEIHACFHQNTCIQTSKGKLTIKEIFDYPHELFVTSVNPTTGEVSQNKIIKRFNNGPYKGD